MKRLSEARKERIADTHINRRGHLFGLRRLLQTTPGFITNTGRGSTTSTKSGAACGHSGSTGMDPGGSEPAGMVSEASRRGRESRTLAGLRVGANTKQLPN